MALNTVDFAFHVFNIIQFPTSDVGNKKGLHRISAGPFLLIHLLQFLWEEIMQFPEAPFGLANRYKYLYLDGLYFY